MAGSQALVHAYDQSGHFNGVQSTYGSGYTLAASGTARGTIVSAATASPTLTANLVEPYGAGDGNGLFQITTGGTQTTGALLTIYFLYPYGYVPTGVSVTISTTAGAAAGGTITTTVTNTSLAISVGTALTTATTYNIRYTIAG